MLAKLSKKYKTMSLPAKASLWFMFCSVVNKGVSFITTPIFTRFLTQEEYGTVNIYNTWMGIITIFATLELATGVFNKAMIKYSNDRDGYTSSSLFLTTCTTIIAFILYLIISKIVPGVLGLPTKIVVMMFLDIFFTTTWSFYTIRNRFDFKYRTIVAVTILANAVGSFLSVLLVWRLPDYHVEAKIGGLLLVKILIYGVFYFLLLKKGRVLFNKDYWKYSVLYNLPLIPHYLSQQILNQSDRIMIDNMCGRADAGIYSLAYQLAVVVQLVTNAVHATFMPWCFQKLANGDEKSIGKRAFQIEMLIGIICTIFSLFAPEFILILGGEKYYSAIYIVPPVSMSVLFVTIYSFFGNIEFYFEKTKFIMIASCAVAALNIVLNWIFIGIYGFVAAGYTTLVCYIVYSIVHYAFMVKICKDNKIDNPFPGTKMWLFGLIMVIVSIGISFAYSVVLLRYIIIGLLLLMGSVYFKKNKNAFF